MNLGESEICSNDYFIFGPIRGDDPIGFFKTDIHIIQVQHYRHPTKSFRLAQDLEYGRNRKSR